MNIKDKKLFLLDMDGTLYLGERLFDKVNDFLSLVKKRGGRYMFLTNNSSRSADAYVEKLGKLGIDARTEDFFTSTEATIGFLLKNGYKDKRIYAFGTTSFRRQLAEAGLNVTDSYEKGISVLLCGFDTELTFKKLDDVSKLLTEKDIPYIATNPDYVCPTEYGYVPDCGSVADMLFNATGKRPLFIGKPEPAMPLYAVEKVRSERDPLVTKETTLVIGDRLYTDIACGINAGTKSMLVLSGETTQKMADESEFKPTVICKDCSVLLDELK